LPLSSTFVNPQLIGSHYLIEDQIGQGAMGVVWRGRDTATGAHRAIKVLRPEYARDPGAVARFVRERTALVLFRHPNVVTLHDMVVEGEQLALVMDLVEGGDLGDHLRARGGTLAAGEAAELTAQVCDALAAAHRAGIVHRDLKPANVLMGGGQARLGDFGIARIAGEASITTAGIMVGTAAYLAPEVIKGQEPGPAADVYAAGITLYELLTGQPPFHGQVAAVMHDHVHTTPDRPPGIPGRLWELILACLGKDPDHRPPAAALARSLRDPAFPLDAITAAPPVPPVPMSASATSSGMVAPPRTGTGTPPAAPARPGGGRRRWTWAAAAALVVAGAVAATALAESAGNGPGGPAAAATPTVSLRGVTASGSRTPHSVARTSGPATSSPASGPGQTPSPSPSRSARHASASPTASATPTKTPPPDTTWTCGAATAATLATGHPTGQTLRACIRVHGGALELRGTLTGVDVAWNEQVLLVLKDSAGKNEGTFESGVCATSTCTFAVTVKPGHGDWATLPKWARFKGNVQSAGQETPFITF
jgi:serine/threonine-protein kinase